jgi:hypothetical protein
MNFGRDVGSIPATTRIRCPKCRSRSFTFCETVEWGTFFNVRNGQLDLAEGCPEPGYPVRVQAQCGCGHSWKVRAIQITSVVVEDEAATQDQVIEISALRQEPKP